MTRQIKRFLPIIVILLGIGTIYFTGTYHYLTLESLRVHHRTLQAFLVLHPILVPILFILIYAIFTALSVPGGIFLSLLGGYLFPQPLSTIYVVFSATCGATALFLSVRSAIGNSLRKKAGPFLKKMEKGFQENAASYLLFLRFVPIFPFWLVNLAPALLGVRLRTYIWTTLIGIIPGALVFTLAGEGLEKILESHESLSFDTIFNVHIKMALFLLGVLSLIPIVIKKVKKNHA